MQSDEILQVAAEYEVKVRHDGMRCSLLISLVTFCTWIRIFFMIVTNFSKVLSIHVYGSLGI